MTLTIGQVARAARVNVETLAPPRATVLSQNRPAVRRCTATTLRTPCRGCGGGLGHATRRTTVRDLTNGLMDVFPKLDDRKLSTYRRLALGAPASPREIAADAGADVEEVRQILSDWIGVYTMDTEQRVIRFWGLAIPEMKHRFEVNGAELHTWCAWDTLRLPELLGKTAHVESAWEMNGRPVRLTVSPVAVESAEPASPVVSFVARDASRFERDIVKSLRACFPVHDDGEG